LAGAEQLERSRGYLTFIDCSRPRPAQWSRCHPLDLIASEQPDAAVAALRV
jgi:hypothetical protein